MTYKPQNPPPKLAPNYGDGWDDVQDQRLRDCAAGGWSRKEAAALMGRTPLAIKGRAQALNLRFIRDSYGRLVRPYDNQAFQEGRAAFEAADRRMVRALAEAFQRGDHLPCEIK